MDKNKNSLNMVEISYYEPIYTIGIASSKLGVSVHTLRQYETEGLILSHKTDTGRRIYSEMEIDKIKCIKRMIRDQGLNFEGIRQLMSMIPCWKFRKCSVKSKESCESYKIRTRPCWSSSEKCSEPLPDCRDCEVYRTFTTCDDVKKYIFK
ncbi:MAG: MerR family transcriptional regulator [Acidobacteriota bacterium]